MYFRLEVHPFRSLSYGSIMCPKIKSLWRNDSHMADCETLTNSIYGFFCFYVDGHKSYYILQKTTWEVSVHNSDHLSLTWVTQSLSIHQAIGGSNASVFLCKEMNEVAQTGCKARLMSLVCECVNRWMENRSKALLKVATIYHLQKRNQFNVRGGHLVFGFSATHRVTLLFFKVCYCRKA